MSSSANNQTFGAFITASSKQSAGIDSWWVICSICLIGVILMTSCVLGIARSIPCLRRRIWTVTITPNDIINAPSNISSFRLVGAISKAKLDSMPVYRLAELEDGRLSYNDVFSTVTSVTPQAVQVDDLAEDRHTEEKPSSCMEEENKPTHVLHGPAGAVSPEGATEHAWIKEEEAAAVHPQQSGLKENLHIGNIALVPRADNRREQLSSHPQILEDARSIQCALCLVGYAPGNLLRGLPCGHSFHCECVDTWLLRKGTCPLCRFQINNAVGDIEGLTTHPV
ncbi:hypothetical protein CEUSTIGMA_g395.t1 [Chlamydomonas eustigma]|uniref:RING-type E3 ubiquitin transferase n=1 Tax=Chlamydomonas eustigma TaxID=1157962 RepID=A0A250WQV9_9CHLO|nr:hypothetical protein CEUSTIGMA_g395.t1 [Chlamydomonas eustigma]|eukprot:GAX72940.1 hypothetical protein CEUSTIGMA_g395.t1 [Chlamydomonas eustigma]